MTDLDVRRRDDVNASWLMEVLRRNGYEVSLTSEGAVFAKHSTRPNAILKVRPEVGIISILESWRVKKGGFGSHKDLLEKINKANSLSWRDTFYIDSDGDLGVSSFITLADELSADDITNHLLRENENFITTVVTSGLIEHVQ